MDPNVIDALRVLGFRKFDEIPKVKEIIRKYIEKLKKSYKPRPTTKFRIQLCWM